MENAKHTRDDNASRAETRQALVKAALRLFGTVGYDGASTREIAATAKANIGSIAYHFGGKDGLRLAVADHIIGLMEAVIARTLAEGPAMPETPEQAEALLLRALERMFEFIAGSEEAADIVPFILREMAQPTAAFERIYRGVFEPVHMRFCQVWSLATGEQADSEEAKLAIFMGIGQAVYFRIGREAVIRRLGWSGVGPDEVKAIIAVARRNLQASIEDRRKAGK